LFPIKWAYLFAINDVIVISLKVTLQVMCKDGFWKLDLDSVSMYIITVSWYISISSLEAAILEYPLPVASSSFTNSSIGMMANLEIAASRWI